MSSEKDKDDEERAYARMKAVCRGEEPVVDACIRCGEVLILPTWRQAQACSDPRGALHAFCKADTTHYVCAEGEACAQRAEERDYPRAAEEFMRTRYGDAEEEQDDG